MREYINKKTGQRIKVESEISGNGWEEIKTPPAPKKKATKAKE